MKTPDDFLHFLREKHREDCSSCAKLDFKDTRIMDSLVVAYNLYKEFYGDKKTNSIS